MAAMTPEELDAIAQRWMKPQEITKYNVDELRVDFWTLVMEVYRAQNRVPPWIKHGTISGN